MRLPRTTTRRIMGVVAAVALASWLATTARRVAPRTGDHVWHLWLSRSTKELRLRGHSEPRSFWPRYRRALLGRPWPGDYVCQCRAVPDPDLVELASAPESASLLAVENRLMGHYRNFDDHRHSAELISRAIAWDEARLAAHNDQAIQAVRDGLIIHGAASTRKAYEDAIANHLKRLRHHERLRGKYEEAARYPWIPVEPDPPEPK